jgi:hypothetical protein
MIDNPQNKIGKMVPAAVTAKCRKKLQAGSGFECDRI